jgi:hypothetical protein
MIYSNGQPASIEEVQQAYFFYTLRCSSVNKQPDTIQNFIKQLEQQQTGNPQTASAAPAVEPVRNGGYFSRIILKLRGIK